MRNKEPALLLYTDTIRASFLLTVLLLVTGCSTPNKATRPIEESTRNPILGSWELENSDSVIHFLSTGRVTIEPGKILAMINRFQNTERNRYTSNLLSAGRYEVLNERELALYVTADWTGKGTGARRPTDKRVESAILFDFEVNDNSILFLQKKKLTQGDSNEPISGEQLELTLHLIK